MEHSVQKRGLLNWLILLVLGSAQAVAAVYAHSATGLVASAFVGLGFLVAIVSYFQMRLEEREQLEQMEIDELKRKTVSETIFTEAAPDTFPARRAREQFEKYVVPVFSALLFLLQVGAAYALWRHVADDRPSDAQRATLVMALNGLFALVFYQFGKYTAVLARLEKQRLLRPQASYLLLGALLSLLTSLAEVAGWLGHPKIDPAVGKVLIIVLAVVAAENLITLVLEIYRPRVKGQAEHPLYESRLVGLLGQPGGLITTLAQALDYQFGFKVSETWFYKFLERALPALILVQFGLLIASSCFVFVEPGEQVLLERFGQPVAGREILNPGPHFKWPWPIDRVYRYQTDRIQTFTVGLVHDEAAEKERTLLWTKSHAKEEFNMLVASKEGSTNLTGGEQAVPVNLLAVNVPVQYKVKDLRAFAYGHANASELLQRIANAEVTRYLVSVDLDELMTTGRRKAGQELQRRIQEKADAMGLGVEVLFVGLHGIHPPVKAAPDFERVVAALLEKDATNLIAKAYAATNVLVARGLAAKKTNEAEAYRSSSVAAAEGTAGRFTNQLAAYKASPEVYTLRSQLDTLGRAMASARTYVLSVTNTHGVAILNLEEKLRKDLLDVMLPASGQK
ncbi:MAG TPA: protease modulator HflK [Verrucomicrobiota bacterium]|nr:protease modulator HflK [Verrucomicrobiota bacterium]HOK77629.1 protease modulator HflK [Verrucomicrobiota bacterium]